MGESRERLGTGNVRRLPPGRDGGAGSKTRHPSVSRDVVQPERDPLGRMALFSSQQRPPPLGTFLVDCSSCRRETPVNPMQLARAALPFSLHVPLLRRYHSYMRCPACGRRTWVRIRWQA